MIVCRPNMALDATKRSEVKSALNVVRQSTQNFKFCSKVVVLSANFINFRDE